MRTNWALAGRRPAIDGVLLARLNLAPGFTLLSHARVGRLTSPAPGARAAWRDLLGANCLYTLKLVLQKQPKLLFRLLNSYFNDCEGFPVFHWRPHRKAGVRRPCGDPVLPATSMEKRSAIGETHTHML